MSGNDIFDGTIHGTDVNEGSLGQVPSALLGGFGRSFGGAGCNPGSTTFVNCGFQTLNLPSQARVLLVGHVTSYNPGNFGLCRLVTNLGVLPNTEVQTEAYETIALTAVTGGVGPGLIDFGVECNQTSGDISYDEIGLSAVAIAAN